VHQNFSTTRTELGDIPHDVQGVEERARRWGWVGSSSSFHNVSAKKKKTLINAKTLFVVGGGGYAQLFANFCVSLGVLETQTPRKAKDGCIRKVTVLRIAHAWVFDFRSIANIKFQCPVFP
jgi:hypothetical protein